MRNRIAYLFYPICILLFLNCASYSKSGYRKQVDKLKKESLHKLNGTYSLYPISRYFGGRQEPNDLIPDSLRYNKAHFFLLNSGYYEKQKLDSLLLPDKEYHIDLHIEGKNKLQIKVLENKKVIQDTALTGKYRNGMFNLDNKFLDCNGIPYIFGGCDHNKRRIGVTKKGNLLINNAISSEGAILLILGAGHRYNVTFEYERQTY